MIATLYLQVSLRSDTTFGRGDGVAGDVDEEVEHDGETGLPLIRGRVLKGLLVDECANLLFALRCGEASPAARLEAAAADLFGCSGSTNAETARLRVSPAQLPAALRQAVEVEVRAGTLTRADVLESLTAVRRQTALDSTGRPLDGSLRSMRVVLRDTAFCARIDFRRPLDLEREADRNCLALLAGCVAAVRRGGTGRSRGRGRLRLELSLTEEGSPVTPQYLRELEALVTGGPS